MRPHSPTLFSRAAWLAAAACAAVFPAYAAAQWDVSLSAGAAQQSDVKKLGVVAGYTQPAPLWQGQTWQLHLRHELELAGWRAPHARNLLEAGYSPVLRLERPIHAQAAVWMDASIGVRLLSHTRVAPERTLSTAFQFSDMVGVGVQWGQQYQHRLGLRYQHVSNAGIKKPNPGMDFVTLHYAYRF